MNFVNILRSVSYRHYYFRYPTLLPTRRTVPRVLVLSVEEKTQTSLEPE